MVELHADHRIFVALVQLGAVPELSDPAAGPVVCGPREHEAVHDHQRNYGPSVPTPSLMTKVHN